MLRLLSVAASAFGMKRRRIATIGRVTSGATLVFGFLTILSLKGNDGTAFAQSLSGAPVIFDVRRSLPMEPNEPVFHDFYISAGPDLGFRKGLFVSVVRQVPVHDPIANKQQGTLNIPIGRLQIIHVEKGITVGRLQSETTNEERPTVEFEAIMIGDKVDPSTLTNEIPSQKGKSRFRAGKASEPKVETAEASVTPEADSSPANLLAVPAKEAAERNPSGQPLAPQKTDPAKIEPNPNRPSPSTPPATAESEPELDFRRSPTRAFPGRSPSYRLASSAGEA